MLSKVLWLSLTLVVACIGEDEKPALSEPPPVIGTGGARGGESISGRSTNALPQTAGASSLTMSAQGSAARSGTAGGPNAADGPTADEVDAGADEPAGRDAGGPPGTTRQTNGGRGGVGTSPVAGNGGRGGANSSDGAGGAGGATQPDPMCRDQVCLTVFECWLLSPDCNYSDCYNFTCQ